MGKEFEMKYKADSRILAEIRALYGDFTPITMESRYFDTPRRELASRRWTLRLRRENGVSICGLKTPGKNLVRGEWEVENPDLKAGVNALCKLDVPEEFPSLVSADLVEVCAAGFTRLAKKIDYQGAILELALDEGDFLGKNQKRHFAEVEVELKEGSRESCEAFGAALAEKYGLETETVSKFERAFALAQED